MQIMQRFQVKYAPVFFLQDKDTKVGTCGYCGLQFKQKHHHWNICSVFASLYKLPYWLINYHVCIYMREYFFFKSSLLKSKLHHISSLQYPTTALKPPAWCCVGLPLVPQNQLWPVEARTQDLWGVTQMFDQVEMWGVWRPGWDSNISVKFIL